MTLPVASPEGTRAASTGQALFFMLISTLLLASMHSCVRYLGPELNSFMIVFFRNLFGFVAVVPLLMRGGIRSLETSRVDLSILRAVIGSVAMQAWFFALTKVPVANATALSFSTTIFATLCAVFFLKERVRIRRWAAILVGLAGVYIVLQPDAEGFNVFALYVLLCSAAWGASITIVKVLIRTDTTTSVVGWMSLSLTIVSLPFALANWETPTTNQFLMLMLIGALATCGHLLMTAALRMADMAIVMSVDFTRLIWVAFIGAIWFQETLDVWTVVGAVIIFSAGWYIIFRESRMAK